MNLLEILKMTISILAALAVTGFVFFLISEIGCSLFVKLVKLLTKLL